MTELLRIEDLHVEVEGKEILKGINLKINEGEIHALMGPNGVGKTSLGYVIAGHPKYKVTKGNLFFKEKNILELRPDERAKLGLFLAFQHPVEIQGVSLNHFLYTINKKISNKGLNFLEFRRSLLERANLIGITQEFLNRQLNVGFSGGEKKRAEVLQLLTVNPKLAVLDEVDSGTDIDSLKTLTAAITEVNKNGTGILLVTHYDRILQYLKPHYIHVLIDGRIEKTGSSELARELESKGYNWLKQEVYAQ
ncbi:MAG: Fe-S cluster assembly ATPase SufC [Candidatus Woesearchaeota archaeon]|nr:MAG: Fe-S cluster assembly ATPase SufC [Candidatus Woesearchaeota archaeon]